MFSYGTNEIPKQKVTTMQTAKFMKYLDLIKQGNLLFIPIHFHVAVYAERLLKDKL